jgi:hypothetical protein
MTDHTVEGCNWGVLQRARGHLRLVRAEVDTVCGDGSPPPPHYGPKSTRLAG